MFCPKCGVQNPADGKFCRSCGADISRVNAAISGDLVPILGDVGLDAGAAQIHLEARRRSDPNEVYGDAVKSTIGGIGFVVVAMALLFTGVAGGKAWWWTMLFPAFVFLARGISDLMKSKRMERSRELQGFSGQPHSLPGSAASQALPPQSASVEMPETRFKTGDLMPPSVTDNTTRNLETHSEGETMTLPKR